MTIMQLRVVVNWWIRMNIVIEGPDASGKSTIAHAIAQATGRQIVQSGGRPKYPGEIEERALRMIAEVDNVVFDRHPCVSERMYGFLRPETPTISEPTVLKFYDTKPLLIYCRPIGDAYMDEHVVKDTDAPDHLEGIQRERVEILRRYDEWALQHATLIRRRSDDTERLIRQVRMFDPMRDVVQFMSKFGIGYEGKPRALPSDLLDFRCGCMDEELGEYRTHARALIDELNPQLFEGEANVVFHLEEAFDALIDKVYFDLGTAHLHGFDFHGGWERVHAANMQKVKATRADRTRRNTRYDVIKPAGWSAPVLTDLVTDHAHQIPGDDDARKKAPPVVLEGSSAAGGAPYNEASTFEGKYDDGRS